MKNKAFTLIELLVVVLIIGILAAVALPQYQTAVNKSRYAGLMPLAKSVKDAEEAQLMATGHYTAKLEDLSVQVPGTIDDNTATTDHVTIELYNGDGNYDFVKATDTRNPANTYVMYFAKSGNFKGEIHCEAEQNNDKAKQLCLSYGPTAGPFTGTDSGYDAYVLQGTGDGTGSGASGGGGLTLGSILSNDNLAALQAGWENACRAPWPGNLNWETIPDMPEGTAYSAYSDEAELHYDFIIDGQEITLTNELNEYCISHDSGISWHCEH